MSRRSSGRGRDTETSIAIAGDTMLGRSVAERVSADPASVVSPEVIEIAAAADVFILNLECCISARGQPRINRHRPFSFRAPPVAADMLAQLGVGCVNLANNHALDYGPVALWDTILHLDRAGIAHTGAGVDIDSARAAAVIDVKGLKLAVLGLSDHPREDAASASAPGIAFADLRREAPVWVESSLSAVRADTTLLTPHWGPNMTASPPEYVQRRAREFISEGVSLIAGHSAHVFHGIEGRTFFDLGDFVDDYAVDPLLRNDLGLLFVVTWDGGLPVRLNAYPLFLDFCFTRLARGEEARWIRERFRAACANFGTEMDIQDGRLVVEL